MSADLMSENCLTINIFRPSNATELSSLPVLFWTHGGGYQTGSASSFNGSALVSQSIQRGTPIIYVNFNYRLGPLGFPQGAEAASRGILNLAIRDQLAALEWVQRHIGAFGDGFRGERRFRYDVCALFEPTCIQGCKSAGLIKAFEFTHTPTIDF
ncbi:Alpha/Beta hydrolase protein [Armillaria fumosa]|nr:Alpha/Beta hydrolase protein [Armillaria fumosa]